MRPKKLSLCAWGPYPNKEEVDFTVFDERGIFLITGATGAGKTTLFDAISYALYGALSGDERDKERSSVRSDFANPQMPTYVELTMEHRGEVYQIRRNPEYFRPKKRKAVKLNSEDVPIQLTKEKENAILYYPDGRVLEGVREVNVALHELLGLDYQQFKKISMIAQGEFARLLIASPKEKTKIFREIFGTGVYERFTQSLGVRTRHLYGKVMEHKARLEEDIRLLSVDIHKKGWDDADKERFETIIAGENWNYEELSECLKQMERFADEAVSVQKKLYDKADKDVARQTTSIAEQEQINRELKQFEEVSKERENLLILEDAYKKKETCYQQAQNAGFIEGTEEKIKQLERQVDANRQEAERITQEQQELSEEENELSVHVRQAERIRMLLSQKKSMEEMEQEQRVLHRELLEKKKEFGQGQENYLKEEETFRRVKADYEEAEHKRNLAAIGLAAALLERGKPCPVCGSLEHPAPAKWDEDIVSEEHLKRLKEEVEQKEQKLHGFHEVLVTLKAQVDNLILQTDKLAAKLSDWDSVLSEEKDIICRSYLEMPTEKGLAILQRRCDRAGQIAGLLQEKAAYKERLRNQEEELVIDIQNVVGELEHLLRQYGFADRVTYQQAKISVKERELLQKEITNYRNKVTANNELYLHLEKKVQKKEYVDLHKQQESLVTAKASRDDALKEQKLWEQNRAEVKKVRKMMQEKLSLIREDGREYGYVKDLENMANGNNAKKLVFEQFVLAGYFEEILRAANIRFRKMTSGRYEMERVGEVGDGRIKDNLEIQVMDYYTGKYRSVRTLSGGESFKASLALALGMSDVIQAMNGGIHVDTLFVDEGFGALDEESLNQACDTLMTLVEKNRLIGIISHVPQLRERVDNQLVIVKTTGGSTIEKNS